MFNPLKTHPQSETYDVISRFINMKKHLDSAQDRRMDSFVSFWELQSVHTPTRRGAANDVDVVARSGDTRPCPPLHHAYGFVRLRLFLLRVNFLRHSNCRAYRPDQALESRPHSSRARSQRERAISGVAVGRIRQDQRAAAHRGGASRVRAAAHARSTAASTAD